METPYLTWDWRLPKVRETFPTEEEAIEYQREQKSFHEYLNEAIDRLDKEDK